MAVNADKLVEIVPRVISAGTSGLSFQGFFLSKNILLPTDRVVRFSSADSVGSYFGTDSDEYQAATIYFAGYSNTQYLPDYLYFGAYRPDATAAWLRGDEYTGTLATLKAVTDGSLTISIDGTEITATGIDFSSCNSLSECAQTLQTALSSGSAEVTYDSQTKAFCIKSGTASADSSVSYGADGESGTGLATLLNLTEALGAVQSVGTDGSSLTDTMTNALKYARDWVSFSTIWEASYDEKIELAKWCDSYDTRFLYVMWDTDHAATVYGSTESAGYAINNTYEYSGTACVYDTLALAAGIMGAVGCLNFDQTNGRTTLAYRQFDGVEVTCDDDEEYENLIDNGYNCYADFATASANYKFLQNGQVSGDFRWIDTYCNAIAIKDRLQLNLLDLFAASRSIPYNDDGYSQIRTACLDTINTFINFGAIRSGITLSNTQQVQLQQEIGSDVSSTIESQGWYMQVSDPGATARQERESPNCLFYYTDGGSIHKLEMSSTTIL